MKAFIKWDYEAGVPCSAPSNAPLEDGGSWLECILPEQRRTSDTQTIEWLLLEGTHTDYVHGRWEGSADPLDAIASREVINNKHRELEISPVMVFGEPFDCDERSEIRMRDAIAYWDLRPLELGVFEEREIEGVATKIVIWTRGDNSFVELTKDQLQAIFHEMLAVRAIRGAILFASLRRFKDDPNTTLRDINDPANWGI